MPFHRKLLFSLLESSHHGELLDSISWRTINSRELLVPLISSGGVFPLTRLYQITHGSGGWENFQEQSDGGSEAAERGAHGRERNGRERRRRGESGESATESKLAPASRPSACAACATAGGRLFRVVPGRSWLLLNSHEIRF